jgi:hypothetical protein
MNFALYFRRCRGRISTKTLTFGVNGVLLPDELVLKGEKVCAVRVCQDSENGKLDANRQLIKGELTYIYNYYYSMLSF